MQVPEHAAGDPLHDPGQYLPSAVAQQSPAAVAAKERKRQTSQTSMLISYCLLRLLKLLDAAPSSSSSSQHLLKKHIFSFFLPFFASSLRLRRFLFLNAVDNLAMLS